jgi:Protein of unknown function (DUF4254)
LSERVVTATAAELVAEMERVVRGEPSTHGPNPNGPNWDGPHRDGPDPGGPDPVALDPGGPDPVAPDPDWPDPDWPDPDETVLANLVGDLVGSNLQQWDLEDTTRDPGASDSVVANAKRAIDRLNIGRHRLVQEIDAAIDSSLDQTATAPIATETPAMALDRLSVLVIRRARTAAAASRDPAFAERVPALEAQVVALSLAFDAYMDELRAGTKRFVPYEHLKLYRPSAASSD